MKSIISIAQVAAALALSAPQLPAHATTITTFDVPGATYTGPKGINRDGTIAGQYHVANGCEQGFVRAPDGTITKFDPQGTLGLSRAVVAGINDAGDVAGYYYACQGSQGPWGFIRAADGTVITYDPPAGSSFFTVYGINNAGTVLAGFSSDVQHGLLRTADGQITIFDAGYSTLPAAIANNGSITGLIVDQSYAGHGFLRDAQGNVTSFDVPGSLSTSGLVINAKNAIAGNYFVVGGERHGFVRAADGTLTLFDPPGSLATYPRGINIHGAVAGTWSDNKSILNHSFIRSGSGRLLTFNPPGAVSSFWNAINSVGSVAGDYVTSDGLTHGYVRNPIPWTVR
ncbi:MAG: hypothetical protein JO056_00690 [Alphaproteobacteria bacterium]|nr:hypothetical protein [Alphaproteobacteria bacterium]